MNYHQIKHDDMNNGEGIRVTLFVSGCLHRCKNCQNPETWGVASGIPFDDDAKKEIFDELSKNYISGLTLSGGDPLHPRNRKDVLDLVKQVKDKFPDKNIWLYTGYDYDRIGNNEVLEYVDVIVDGKYVEELKSESNQWVGSSNQRVIYLCG